MRERDYLRLKRQIEADYRKKMEALELVWKMAGRHAEAAVKPPRTAVLQLARSFVKEWTGGDFSLDDVVRHIRQAAPNVAVNRTSVSGALRRLALNGELEVVFPGKGNKPRRYRPPAGDEKAA